MSVHSDSQEGCIVRDKSDADRHSLVQNKGSNAPNRGVRHHSEVSGPMGLVFGGHRRLIDGL